MKNKNASFPYIISRFFQAYLPGERGYSGATVSSYRDTFKQLLIYCRDRCGKQPEQLRVTDISRDVVVGFLDSLEAEGRSISTRNQRLAAIKCFFRYISYAFPEYLDISSSIIAIKMKKQPEPAVSYMSVEGVACVLRQPDMHRRSGYRDALMSDVKIRRSYGFLPDADPRRLQHPERADNAAQPDAPPLSRCPDTDNGLESMLLRFLFYGLATLSRGFLHIAE